MAKLVLHSAPNGVRQVTMCAALPTLTRSMVDHVVRCWEIELEPTIARRTPLLAEISHSPLPVSALDLCPRAVSIRQDSGS